MAGDIVDPSSYTEGLRTAAGRSAEALTDAVISEVGTIKAAIARGEAGRDGMDRAIAEIKGLANAAKSAAIEAKQRAIPAGDEADAVRAYLPPEVGDLEGRCRDIGTGTVSTDAPYLRVGDSTPIRMVGGYDTHGDWQEGYLTDPAPRSEGQHRAQTLAADLALVNAMRAAGCRRANGGKTRRRFMRHLSSLPHFSRMFADNAGEGAEWQPDVQGTRLLVYMQLARPVAGLFRTVAATDGMTNPFLTSGLQPYSVGTPAAGDLDPANLKASQIGTSEISYNVHTLAVTTTANRDASEDSIVAFAPTMRAALAQALLDAREDAILNGDNAASHGDTGIDSWSAGGRWTPGSAADHRKMFLGLRHRAIDSSATDDFDDGNISSDFIRLHGKLTKGYSRGNLAAITSLEALIYHFLVDSNFLTMDRMGQNATLLTGQVGAVAGVPIVISEFMSSELNTAGIYDNSDKTQTGLVLVDTSRVVRPVRREARTETEVEAKKHVVHITATDREGLTFECQSSEKPVAYAIDIASST
jgi:HK97 family phage major capsid protein